jgi:hypothetical protein
MALNLVNYDALVRNAVQHFWQVRLQSSDGDNRQAVVQGKHLDGFSSLVEAIVEGNGLSKQDIETISGRLHLPGYYRATKQWDLLILHKGILVAAFEFKSQLGPSFGNNFNNRTEEVLGSAVDLWKAYREGAFGTQIKPFLGYIILLEDCDAVHRTVSVTSPHFDTFSEFKNASYAKRYEILCDKLIKERLYDSASLILSPRTAAGNGQYAASNLKDFVAKLAGHIATVAASSI